MSDDGGAIIARPPSHPIATSLLICCVLGTLICIGIVWNELFTEYLPSPGPGVKIDKSHNSKSIAEKHRRDHYGADPAFRVSIEEELGGKDRPLSSVVGDGLGRND
ncbi:MAG: hypothetical protein D6731_04200 [Planctomycetota bacterium]|nr:MAG: hypothetical protein D6731_04200 [Planctomycetota bacterium]